MDTAKKLYKVVVPVYTLFSNAWEFSFLHILMNSWIVCLFSYSHWWMCCDILLWFWFPWWLRMLNSFHMVFPFGQTLLWNVVQYFCLFYYWVIFSCWFVAMIYTLSVSVFVTQPCPTLCNPVDCSLPGSFVHGILQARILEWIAISFSNIRRYVYYKCISVACLSMNRSS